MKRVLFIGLALGALLAAGRSDAKPRSGLDGSAFLGKPSGARFLGLGETGAALPGTPQAPMYNPAALDALTATQLGLDFDLANQSALSKDVILRASSLRGRKLTYLGFAAPAKAVFYRPLADFDETTVTVATDPANNFIQSSLQVSQFGISASQKTEKGYSVGLGLSYLTGRRGFALAASGQPPVLEIADGNGFALDWGFRDQQGPILYGLSILNFPGIIYWDRYKADQLPVVGRAGLGFQPVPGVVFFSDYEKRFKSGAPKPHFWHFGLEIAPLPWLALRSGALSSDFNDRNKTVYSYGLGLATAQKHSLDLSLRTEHLQDQRVNRYGLSLNFPLPQEDASRPSAHSSRGAPPK
ncbi:MAG TPA: hypothetical protein PKB12_00060 [Elusimicrobiota bacterium]|nr:hypothetical protein [Elusimicrobiota bacterium]HMX42093.1 hypothetical protein [Elusimicrobiota bacterium]HNA60088.1 hypothetical protein [Elusimicrobiota bacterium]